MALGPAPVLFIPDGGLAGGGDLGEVEAFQAAPGLGFGLQGLDVEITVRVVCDDGIRRAVFPDPGGERTRVDAGRPITPRLFSQASRWDAAR